MYLYVKLNWGANCFFQAESTDCITPLRMSTEICRLGEVQNFCPLECQKSDGKLRTIWNGKIIPIYKSSDKPCLQICLVCAWSSDNLVNDTQIQFQFLIPMSNEYKGFENIIISWQYSSFINWMPKINNTWNKLQIIAYLTKNVDWLHKNKKYC